MWARLIAGEAFGAKAKVKTHSPIFYVHWALQAGARAQLPGGAVEQVGAQWQVPIGKVERVGGTVAVWIGEGLQEYVGWLDLLDALDESIEVAFDL